MAEVLRVTGLKNWLRCPRLLYFQEVMGLDTPPTVKMKEGKQAQEELERLDKRRTVGRYGVDRRERIYGRQLRSERLGLTGCPDLLLEGPASVTVVEFKLTAADPASTEWLQLASYGVLVEDVMGKPVDQVMVYRIPDEAVFRHAFHDGWRRRVAEVLAAARSVREGRVIPEAPEGGTVCRSCEYINFCGDTW